MTEERQALMIGLINAMKQEGSWCGETHIQKCTFFLQELLGVPLDYDFVMYKHGPFSFQLRDELTMMRADKLLSLEARPPYGGSFTPDKLAARYENYYQEYINRCSGQITFIACYIGNRTVKDLEKLATALFVTKRNAVSDKEAAVSRICDLKPHLSAKEAREALEEVSKLEANAEAVGFV